VDNSAGLEFDPVLGPAVVSSTSGGLGGAVYLASGGEVTVVDSVFQDNLAAAGGGGECRSVSFPMPMASLLLFSLA
jgi:hypothetical protein